MDDGALGAEQQFHSFLNNKDGALDKDHGVLIAAGPARDLQPLEESCFDGSQTWNSVITARYTLDVADPAAVFGTLVRKLAGEASDHPSSNDTQYGSLRELGKKEAQQFSNPITWNHFRSLAETIDSAMPSDDGASLDPQLIADVFRRTFSAPDEQVQKKQSKAPRGRDSFLEEGQRLVVFLQLAGDVEDSDTWSGFLQTVAGLLPYRVMLVIAGLPDEVQLDPDDPAQQHLTLNPIEAIEQESSVEPVVTYLENSAISDEPSTGDELGRRPYANALAQMLLHEQTVPPLSFGIHGPWGKGKSSFMAQIKEELHKEKTKTDTPIVTVDFNAWRYDDATQVWAGLLNKASAEIENELGHLRTLYINVLHVAKTRTAELLWAIALPMLILFAAVSLGWLLDVRGIEFLQQWLTGSGDLSDLEKALLPVLGGAGSLLLLLKRLAAVTQPVSVRIANFAKLPSYSEELGFQHTVIDDLQFLRNALLKYRPGARVVAFIDDLDRCSEDRIMEILQAIILVLGPAKFYVFLGIDTGMIYRAINKHYTTDGEPPTKSFARQYLRKILQLSFHLPAIDPNMREQLLQALFSEESVDGLAKIQKTSDTQPHVDHIESVLPPLRVDLSLLRSVDTPLSKEASPGPELMVLDTPHELAAFGDYQACLDDNPREIKRAVNIHRLMKLMMQKHGLPGGGWSVEAQRQLVRWVLFCTCWPELVAHALELADDASSEADVLDRCVADHASEITDPQRRARLAFIAAQDGDELPPDAIDSALRFVARSSLLVEDVEEPQEVND